jgi:hypothetical protein
VERAITINGGVIRDAISGEVDETTGDPIVRERMAVVFAKDCARRKLLAVLLPGVDAEGRAELEAYIQSWPDRHVRMAAMEVLEASPVLSELVL